MIFAELNQDLSTEFDQLDHNDFHQVNDFDLINFTLVCEI